MPEPEEPVPEPEELVPEPMVTVQLSGSAAVSQSRVISTPGISISMPSAVCLTLADSSPLRLMTLSLIFSTAACVLTGKPINSAADTNTALRAQ